MSDVILLVRCAIGGVFMGLANLVPGISGGTMLLAAGIYPQFIEAIANFTSFKFHKKDFLTLLGVGCAAGLAILLFAGVIRELVIMHRWAMYSLFIGLTLGGAPLLLKLLGKFDKRAIVFAVIGLLLMIALAFFQANQLGAGQEQEGADVLLMFVAGIAGASAMILPGVSGGYLLLVLGCYLPILQGIDLIKIALKAKDLAALWDPIMNVVLPVGIGVVAGVVVVSHVLKWCLDKYDRETYSFLLGLLCGAVFGLWPFQDMAPLASVEVVKGRAVEVVNGQLVFQVSGEAVKLKDIPTVMTFPDMSEGALALLIVFFGFILTIGISKIGKQETSEDPTS